MYVFIYIIYAALHFSQADICKTTSLVISQQVRNHNSGSVCVTDVITLVVSCGCIVLWLITSTEVTDHIRPLTLLLSSYFVYIPCPN